MECSTVHFTFARSFDGHTPVRSILRSNLADLHAGLSYTFVHEAFRQPRYGQLKKYFKDFREQLGSIKVPLVIYGTLAGRVLDCGITVLWPVAGAPLSTRLDNVFRASGTILHAARLFFIADAQDAGAQHLICEFLEIVRSFYHCHDLWATI